MRMNTLAFLVCGLLAGICVTQEEQAESIAEPEVAKLEVLTDLGEALVTANKTGKSVFVYVFDSECDTWCRSLEEGLADGQFAVLKDSHIVLKLDMKNGKAEFCEELDVKRNNCYVLLMNISPSTLRTTAEGKPIRPLVESIRFTNPKELKKILGCVKVIEGESDESGESNE